MFGEHFELLVKVFLNTWTRIWLGWFGFGNRLLRFLFLGRKNRSYLYYQIFFSSLFWNIYLQSWLEIFIAHRIFNKKKIVSLSVSLSFSVSLDWLKFLLPSSNTSIGESCRTTCMPLFLIIDCSKIHHMMCLQVIHVLNRSSSDETRHQIKKIAKKNDIVMTKRERERIVLPYSSR